MAKYNFDVVFAAAIQTSVGTMDTTLDGITTAITTADGLVLGQPGNGVSDSGVSISAQRRSSQKPVVAGSFTRPISDFLEREVSSLTFAFPMVGPRTVTTTPLDSEFQPIRGVDAIFQGVGMQWDPWGGGVGYVCSPRLDKLPFSILLYIAGERFELIDCKTSQLAIQYNAGEVPVAVATIRVGSVQEVVTGARPATVTYGVQSTVISPSVESVGFSWGATRGFESATVTLTHTLEEVGDSNEPTGFVDAETDFVATFEGTLYKDDSDEAYESDQLAVLLEANLDPLTFLVGTVAGAGDNATAHRVLMNDPELTDYTPAVIGNKSGATISLRGSSSSQFGDISFQYE